MKNDCFSANKFFLAANTTKGFWSLFENLYYPEKNWFCHILKGGPGTGKSTLMKKAAKEAAEKSIKTELVLCSSDPESLDAVIFPELKKCIADGTAPHILEPIFPGVSDEIVNLGEFWNDKKLQKSKNEIIDLCKKNSDFHKKSSAYLKAYGRVFEENKKIILENTDLKKLKSYCEKLSKKLFKHRKKELCKSSETQFFLSSVTPNGYIFLEETIENSAEKIFVIEDKHDFVGNAILKIIRQNALKAGQNIISCPSPFDPQNAYDTLIIKEIKTAIVINNPQRIREFSKISKSKIKKIKSSKFLNQDALSKNKILLNFNYKVCREFLKESVKNLSDAKNIHDKLEKIYAQSMNYSKINKTADKLISAVL